MVKSKKEQERIHASVNATLEFEGLQPSQEANDANLRMLNGEITGDEARRIILSKYKLGGK